MATATRQGAGPYVAPTGKKKDKGPDTKDMIGIMVKLDLTSFAKDGTNTTEVFAVPKSKGDDTIAYAIQVRVAGYHAVVLESQLLIESAAGLRVRVLCSSASRPRGCRTTIARSTSTCEISRACDIALSVPHD